MTRRIAPFPVVDIEDIPVVGFQSHNDLFDALLEATEHPNPSVFAYLNVHVANMAHRDPGLKHILQQADVVYCDGAGIVLASRLAGQPLPGRLTAADWFMHLMATLAEHNKRVYLLGGAPGVGQRTLHRLEKELPAHPVVGMHHGFILEDPDLESRVIAEINALAPDILIVGFGTPLQEHWIARRRKALNVPVVYAVGAVMDFVAGEVSRCPAWMGQWGLEWFYRLCIEPRRMFTRYVVGNPAFLTRILSRHLGESLRQMLPRHPLPLR